MNRLHLHSPNHKNRLLYITLSIPYNLSATYIFIGDISLINM